MDTTEQTFLLPDFVNHSANTTFAPPQPTQSAEIIYYSQLVKNLNIYLTPLIILLGLITNTLSLLVFLCTNLTKHSSSIYLASLALADNGFLLSLAIGWFGWINIHLFHKPVLCQLTIYLGSISSFLSVYYVTAFTVERFIAVNFPLKRHVMCTVKRAKIVCLMLAIFALVFYSYALWTNGTIDILPKGTACVRFQKYENLVQSLSYIDTIMTLLIPSATIITLNTLIAIKIYQTFKHRRSLNAATLSYSAVSFSKATTSSSNDEHHHENGDKQYPKRKFHYNNGSSSQSECSRREDSDKKLRQHMRSNSAVRTPHPSASSSQMRTTRLLWIVSSVFVLLNTPSHAFKLHFIYIQHFTDMSLSASYPLWQECVQLVYYVNFSINFFLYSACAKRFRQGLRKLFRWSSCKRR